MSQVIMKNQNLSQTENDRTSRNPPLDGAWSARYNKIIKIAFENQMGHLQIKCWHQNQIMRTIGCELLIKSLVEFSIKYLSL